MTIGTLFFIFIGVFVLAIVGVAYNMVTAMDGRTTSMGSLFKKHLLFGVIALISQLGMLVTGIMWLVKCFGG